MPLIKLAAERRKRQAPPGMQPPENAADWFRVENSAEDSDATDIYVYSSIGGWFGMWADEFIDELKAVTTPKINLRLNSPGGSVFDGIAIANALRAHPANVTVYVDSLAASIASVIMLAGDKVIMQPQSQVMIHAASGACYGDASEMVKMAELLEFQTRNIAEAYADRTGRTVDEFLELMAAESWFSAKEAVEMGLADEFVPMRTKEAAPADDSVAARMHRSWDLSMYRYAGREHAPTPVASPFAKGGILPGMPVTAAMINGIAVDNKTGTETAPAAAPQTVTLDLSALGADETFQNLIRDLIRESLADAAPPFLPKKGEGDEEDDEDEEEEAENASDEEPTDAASREPVTARSPRSDVIPIPAEGLKAGDAEPPSEHPVDTGLGSDTVESTETYDEADDWTQVVGSFISSTSPSADDVFAQLKEGW